MLRMVERLEDGQDELSGLIDGGIVVSSLGASGGPAEAARYQIASCLASRCWTTMRQMRPRIDLEGSAAHVDDGGDALYGKCFSSL